jgi:23S rRNA pseudouridine2605 synthase
VAKVIARAGLGSRRDVEAWIEEGRVAVNGETLTSAARNVTENDVVTVDGQLLPKRERTRLWLYHKPRGLVTTEKDPEGRPTVFQNLPEGLPRVLSIGRLDINTEGLLLLTNDGGLARILELPKTGWMRRYRVRAFGETDQAALDELFRGTTVDGVDYGPIEARLDKEQGSNMWMTLGLREGKNREVKAVLGSIGLEVNRLIRVSYGPFQLGDLAEGAVAEVPTRVLADQLGPALIEEAGCALDAPVFERVPDKPAARETSPRRRGLRVKADEDGAPDRVMRGGLIEDRRGRRVLVQRVSDAEEETRRPPRRAFRSKAGAPQGRTPWRDEPGGGRPGGGRPGGGRPGGGRPSGGRPGGRRPPPRRGGDDS